MKIYLDDERNPKGKNWIVVRTVNEFKEIYKEYYPYIDEISLDHDLGTDETGYDALTWLEEQIITKGWDIPDINIHSANPSGRDRMKLVIKSLYKYKKYI
jgi:hypothetical protein